MHTINLAEKAYIMKVDFKTTLGTTVLKNIVIRSRNKNSHNKAFITISDLQIKQITIKEDYNISMYSLFV